MNNQVNLLKILNQEIVSCEKCTRLVVYREKVARDKRRAYRDWTYWGKPVPGFGDAKAELLLLGLAPGAHGSNRTGRMFTGDRSGDFLYAALHKAGIANQATSLHRDDGLQLSGAYISATARCAPPGNKPLPGELRNCAGYLERELEILRPKAILALGKIAWDGYLEILKRDGRIASRAAYRFGHGAEVELPAGAPRLFGVYHPSQQNTQTGRVTAAMYAQVFKRVRSFLAR
ncbi:MAG: uracil-DNA glycosylase family protein [Candidatus Acidiferrum sp.]